MISRKLSIHAAKLTFSVPNRLHEASIHTLQLISDHLHIVLYLDCELLDVKIRNKLKSIFNKSEKNNGRNGLYCFIKIVLMQNFDEYSMKDDCCPDDKEYTKQLWHFNKH